ncbi:flagellar hook-associated protein FlgK [Planctobacterium marinum]|uniref:Flagellar hook-associated protein 1 n=1 Tax=Planctobacterium marinum TaxID=1631968 RepID=A0AA48HQI0_9ALTE|nr:flagellar hook protein FlgK [Planctobacterium marinum]
MIQTDIFTIASSGLNAQQGLLNTTANNIANVNTEGYVRQKGILQEQDVGGVLLGNVERVVDRFAQEQHVRDTSSLGEANQYLQKLNQLDNIFASEAISAAEGMSRYFAALQTATDDPNNVASREIVISEAEAMIKRFNNIDGYLETSVEVVNEELDDKLEQANDLIQQIADLNAQIKSTQFAPQTSGSESVKNQRDQAILALSELAEITTQPRTDGSTLVFMGSGQALVLEDGSFNVFSDNGNPDPTYKDLVLVASDNTNVSIPLSDEDLGGELGGLIRYRDEILEPNIRELGQIALAITDAMNEQNKLGMDLDNQLGTSLFTTPEFGALTYEDNTGTGAVNARVPDGGGAEITSADYQITITGGGGTTSIDFDIALLNPDGSPVTDSSGAAIRQSLTGVDISGGGFITIPAGDIGGDIEIQFPDGTAYADDDQFLIQPAKEAASAIAMATNRPEDLALASPVRVESNLNNLGTASVSSISVTNTEVSAGTEGSAFDGAGGIQGPGASPHTGGDGAPTTIVFTAADSFEVRDSAGAVLATVNGASSLENLLTQAAAVPWDAGFTGQDDYPGYDLSIEGIPQAGDTFTIAYNTDGFNDNSNGVKLAGLQEEDLMLRGNDGNSTQITFHEAYAGIVTEVGSKTASAQVEYDAAVAMERQSKEWVDSVSGVNLDEEASDLIRFQQAYAASARVLTTAQSLFQTILGAVS